MEFVYTPTAAPNAFLFQVLRIYTDYGVAARTRTASIVLLIMEAMFEWRRRKIVAPCWCEGCVSLLSAVIDAPFLEYARA
jgi:hypothetical protein